MMRKALRAAVNGDLDDDLEAEGDSAEVTESAIPADRATTPPAKRAGGRGLAEPEASEPPTEAEPAPEPARTDASAPVDVAPDAMPVAAAGTPPAELEPEEVSEWIESLDDISERYGPTGAQKLIELLIRRVRLDPSDMPSLVQTPYINTIAPDEQPSYPGDQVLEKRIRRIIRWNAVAMVLRANKHFPGIGGHLSTYASAATLYEVGFNHFFRGKDGDRPGDIIYFQGHASPGIYARAFLEGRITREQMEHFRREVVRGQGLSSYPHPWLMPDFWEFPTVSMGLGPISAIYQARFYRYLVNRGILPGGADEPRVWAFLGDGETDEPEALGSLSIATREKLDNLIFVVNCNLQRLDGPVRGNGKIIQELEAVFHGAGWNVIKVVWGREWDDLLARDTDGVLVKRMNEVVDGKFQRYSVEDGSYIRQDFFGADPRLLALVEHLSDDEIERLRRGGHDASKVYAAYAAACEHRGAPTVILAKTVKGWTLGEGAEGRNVSHQAKKLNLSDLRAFRDVLELPIPDSQLEEAPFYMPPPDSPVIEYLKERRSELGGSVPKRTVRPNPLPVPPLDFFSEFFEGSKPGLDVSTTMVFAKILARLLADSSIGKRIVPIIPDEARTFGLEALFKKHGIYSAVGQLYEPVDHHLAHQLSRGQGRPDDRGGDHRGGIDGELHRRRNGLRHPRRADDPDVHLLLDVRLPAHRRPDLGRRRLAGARLHVRRHRRPHHPLGRGTAARGRAQPSPCEHGAQLPGLRSRLRVRSGGHHLGRAPADVRRGGGCLLLHHPPERELPDAPDARGRTRRHHPRALPLPGRPGGAAGEGVALPAPRLGLDPERGAEGAGPPRRALRSGGRCLERDELHAPPARGVASRALEPAASRRAAPPARTWKRRWPVPKVRSSRRATS